MPAVMEACSTSTRCVNTQSYALWLLLVPPLLLLPLRLSNDTIPDPCKLFGAMPFIGRVGLGIFACWLKLVAAGGSSKADVDPSFPDIPPDELMLRSSHFTYQCPITL